MFKLLLLISFFFISIVRADDLVIEHTGDVLAVLIPVSAYGSTLYMDDFDGQIAFYKSIGVASVVTFGLKYSVKRERPDGSNTRSFPSGHTMYAFQGATFIHRRYGLQYALAAYTGALFVGYSRIKSDKHYLGDVLAGAAIGTLSSWFFTERYKTVTLRPLAQNGSYGVTLTYLW